MAVACQLTGCWRDAERIHLTCGIIGGRTVQLAAGVLDIHDIALVRRGVGRVAVDGKDCFAGWNVNLLFVGSSKDENALSGCGGRAQRVDCLLDLPFIRDE